MELKEEGDMVGWIGQQNWHPVFLSTPIAIMAAKLTNLFVLWSPKLWYNFNWFVGPMSQEVPFPPVWPPKVPDWPFIECALLLSLDAISSMVKCSADKFLCNDFLPVPISIQLGATFSFCPYHCNSAQILALCDHECWVRIQLGSGWILLDWLWLVRLGNWTIVLSIVWRRPQDIVNKKTSL